MCVCVCIYIYVYIYHHHHVVRPAWISLTLSLHSLPLASLQGYIPYHLIAAVCMFMLFVLLLIGHMQGSTGVHHLRARPCSSGMSGSYGLDSFREGC